MSVLMKKPPKIDNSDFPILNFYQSLEKDGKVKINKESLEKHYMNTTLEVQVECLCPYCKQKSTLSLNTQKNVYFCMKCKKGGGVISAIAFYTNRTIKEVLQSVALKKVHPLLRLTEKQVAFIGYSPSEIEKLELKNDFESMDYIFKEYQLYQQFQMSFIYALFLLATIRKNPDEMKIRLEMLNEYAFNVGVRSDFLTQCMKQFDITMKLDMYKKAIEKTDTVYLSLQREIIEENGVFISYENTVKNCMFGEDVPQQAEWALQGASYARQAFNMSMKHGDKHLIEVEQNLFKLREYKNLERLLTKKEIK